MAENACALIVGAGSGLSASLARRFVADGYDIVLAARDIEKLGPLVEETGARAIACDASKKNDVNRLFEALIADCGTLDLVVYNPSMRTRGPITEIDPDEVEIGLAVTVFGAFLVGQAAAKRMTGQGSGSIFFTGASAGVKGYSQSASFAMGKFGLRGLAQSMARELAPRGIHVAHFVIDGGIRPRDVDQGNDKMLDPDAIAETYYQTHRQHRSAWSWEIEVRPWLETF
jgi:NAD(P)-dependent dehydrogenase (short-subunit alcohol dehydrogenase family)